MSETSLVASRIKHLREKRGLSQGTLASLAQTTQGYLSMIEAGIRDNISSAVIAKIAVALDTSTDYLLGLVDDPQPRASGRGIPPDVYELALRLSDLAEEDRRSLLEGFTGILDAVEALHAGREAEDAEQQAREDELVELLDQLPEPLRVQARNYLAQLLAEQWEEERKAG